MYKLVFIFALANCSIHHEEMKKVFKNHSEYKVEKRKCIDSCLINCKICFLKTSSNLSCIQTCFDKCGEKEREEEFENLKNQYIGLQKNYCINGKNLKSKKDRLKEFIKGPCNPVMLVPGLMSTRLQVEIDCKKLKQNYPVTFYDCGWTTCNKYDWQIWETKPNPEYHLWIPSEVSPMSAFAFLRK